MFARPWASSHSEKEINDSNVPFGSGGCLNGIPPSAAKGGELGGGVGRGSFRPLPGWAWMELDEGLCAKVCFCTGQASAGQATENQLTAGAKDPPFHEEHRMSESLKRLQNRGEPRVSSRMGSAFPGVYCPGQRTRELPGRRAVWGPSGRRPRGTALPWTLYEGHRWRAWLLWFVQNAVVRGGGEVGSAHRQRITQDGPGQKGRESHLGILAQEW